MGSCISCRTKSSKDNKKNGEAKSNELLKNTQSSSPLTSIKNNAEIIAESDFLIGAQQLGPVSSDVALSAFRIFDKNNNHFLSVTDAYAAYSYLQRLYDY
jgi:hypothetical protein